MAVEFISGYDCGGDGDHSFVSNNDATTAAAVGEAACGGIESVEKLMDMISEQKHEENDDYSSLEKEEFAGVAVSILDNNKPRTRLLGHARFRRAPSSTTLLPNNLQLQQMDHEKETINATRFFELSKEKDGFSPQQRSKEEQVSSSAFKLYCPISILPPLPQRKRNNNYHDYPSRFSHNQKNNNVEANNGSSTSIDFSTTNSCTYLSTLTNNIDDDHGFQIQRVSLNKGSSSSYMQKPPLSNSSLNKRKCNSLDNNVQSSSSKCHCYKKRKSKLKRVIRVAAISSKTADIPSDDFSWRKYGQKPIKGSPHPRGYYKCTSVRGCPARKHVERAVDDPNMLVVTYEGEHNHTLTHDDYANDAVILQSS
ncbi:hypothetical protein HN51_017588 [Arachis hypogaea]|uniref:WRKY domain-containing protein n=1 Tax=Arachis hypogaea TaxID=3818 RepID=A0A445CY01_ARAHY|nr:probable WRKY transcription factor 7 [Arachis hypogaea]XP_025660320.1 probable WRKY transcription factor 7 [Arachis hypogaea]QHN88517.1 putative WRKY transcription factor [Arachis hypogaea]RYR55734.1 hypothetical protein Ahy_A06g030912 [Arachis hypogaea]